MKRLTRERLEDNLYTLPERYNRNMEILEQEITAMQEEIAKLKTEMQELKKKTLNYWEQ